MPRKGGKGKNKGKKSGAAAAAASNKAAEAVIAVTPGHQVEETIAKGEGEIESVSTEAAEAPTALPAVAVPDTTTKIPATAPPNFTEAASNAAKIPIPTTESQTVQDAVNKAQVSKMGQIGSPEEGKTDVLPEATANEAEESKLTTGAIASDSGAAAAATTSLPDRSKGLNTEDTHVKRPHEDGPTTKEEDQKPPKIAKVDDVPTTEASAASTAVAPGGKENVATKSAAPTQATVVQPQMVPGLGADPADKTSKTLEVPGLSVVNNQKAAAATTTKPQAVEAVVPSGAATSDKEVAPIETKPAVAEAQKETPSVTKPVAATTGTVPVVGASTIETAKENASEVHKEIPAAAETSIGASGIGATVTSSIDTAKEKAKEVPKEQQERLAAATGFDTTKDTSVVDTAKEKAKEISTKQETPVVTKPPTAVTPLEKANAAPSTSQAGTATEQVAPVVMPSSLQTGGEKAKKRLSSEAPAAKDTTAQTAPESAAATQKDEQTKPLESQAAQAARAAHEAQTAGGTTAAKPEEGKTVTEQAQDAAQDAAQKEAAKAEKRKSGGFWGWVKRKVKGA